VHQMRRRNAHEEMDFEALRHAIEHCEPHLMLGFYAEDARLSIVNALTPHASPFELRGKGEIAKHLRAAFGKEASHRLEHEVVSEDRVTFREACEYSDGGRVVVETTLELRDGKIARQVDVVKSDARAISQERPRTAHLKYERRGGRDPAEPSSAFQATEKED
jgi:SnoaL-like protein